jgi:hypothetical protein
LSIASATRFFRAEAFFDVREVTVLGFEQVRAFAANIFRLAKAVTRQLGDRRRGLALAGALERVEHVVLHAGGFVVHRRGHRRAGCRATRQ